MYTMPYRLRRSAELLKLVGSRGAAAKTRASSAQNRVHLRNKVNSTCAAASDACIKQFKLIGRGTRRIGSVPHNRRFRQMRRKYGEMYMLNSPPTAV